MSFFDTVAKLIGPEDPAERRAAAAQAEKDRASSRAWNTKRIEDLTRQIEDIDRSIDPKRCTNWQLHRTESLRNRAFLVGELKYAREELRHLKG